MAKLHVDQDSSGTAGAKVPLFRRYLAAAGSPGVPIPALWATLVSGLNAWLVIAAWPILFVDAVTTGVAAAASLPLPLLAAGVLLPRRAPATAPWLLLFAFPCSLFGAVALYPEAVEQRAFTPPALVVAVLSMLLYGASAAWAASRTAPVRRSESRALDLISPSSGRPLNPRLRRLVIALALAGAFAIAVVAPTLGGLASLQRDWGEAATRGAVFTAVVGATLASVVVAVFLGPALRADYRRATLSRRARRIRVASMLFLSLLGALTYLVIR